MMDPLDIAIEKTIKYGRFFGAEYGPEQIKQRLISDNKFSDKEIDLRLIGIKQSKLRDYGKIEIAKDTAMQLSRYFKDILLIGITGSVAAGYPNKDDDIDLMIVTKKDRLWLTRLALRIFVILKHIPHRKYGREEARDEFCFNLWLEEDSLKLPANRQTLRNAMDAMLMIPVVNKENIYQKFMKENNWIKRYLINSYVKNTK